MTEQNKDHLKIQALRQQFSEKIGVLTDDYENRIADLRVELTEAVEKNKFLLGRVEELQSSLTELKVVDVQENTEATDSN